MTICHWAVLVLSCIAALEALLLWWRWWAHDCAQDLPETTRELLEERQEAQTGVSAPPGGRR